MSKYDRKVCILIVCMTAGLNEIPSESFNEKKNESGKEGKNNECLMLFHIKLL